MLGDAQSLCKALGKYGLAHAQVSGQGVDGSGKGFPAQLSPRALVSVSENVSVIMFLPRHKIYPESFHLKLPHAIKSPADTARLCFLPFLRLYYSISLLHCPVIPHPANAFSESG